jgi:hypothetical protein
MPLGYCPPIKHGSVRAKKVRAQQRKDPKSTYVICVKPVEGENLEMNVRAQKTNTVVFGVAIAEHAPTHEPGHPELL